MPQNYQWISTKKGKVLYMHLASDSLQEVQDKISEFRTIIENQSPTSLYTITDIKNGHFSKAITNEIKQFSNDNRPYIIHSVVIGMNTLQNIIYTGVLKSTRRSNITVKNTMEEAIEFIDRL